VRYFDALAQRDKWEQAFQQQAAAGIAVTCNPGAPVVVAAVKRGTDARARMSFSKGWARQPSCKSYWAHRRRGASPKERVPLSVTPKCASSAVGS
jgi:hypothetical protein